MKRRRNKQNAKAGRGKGMMNQGVTVTGSGTRIIPKRGYEQDHLLNVGNMVTGKLGDADYNGIWRTEHGC